MNKKLLVSFALASLTGISTQAKEKMSSETTQQRPNIILFMVDDMGWQDTSLPFSMQPSYMIDISGFGARSLCTR